MKGVLAMNEISTQRNTAKSSYEAWRNWTDEKIINNAYEKIKDIFLLKTNEKDGISREDAVKEILDFVYVSGRTGMELEMLDRMNSVLKSL
jgi:hypothetical protein